MITANRHDLEQAEQTVLKTLETAVMALFLNDMNLSAAITFLWFLWQSSFKLNVIKMTKILQ